MGALWEFFWGALWGLLEGPSLSVLLATHGCCSVYSFCLFFSLSLCLPAALGCLLTLPSSASRLCLCVSLCLCLCLSVSVSLCFPLSLPPPSSGVSLQAASISKSLSAFMAVLTALAIHCAAARRKNRGTPGGPPGGPLSLLLHGGPPAGRLEDTNLTGAPNKGGLAATRPPTQSNSCSKPPDAAAGGPPSRRVRAPRGPHVRFRESCLTVALKDVLVRGSTPQSAAAAVRAAAAADAAPQGAWSPPSSTEASVWVSNRLYAAAAVAANIAAAGLAAVDGACVAAVHSCCC